MKITCERETQKRKKQKQNKDRKEQGTKAMVKGWELNDFVVRLN